MAEDKLAVFSMLKRPVDGDGIYKIPSMYDRLTEIVSVLPYVDLSEHTGDSDEAVSIIEQAEHDAYVLQYGYTDSQKPIERAMIATNSLVIIITQFEDWVAEIQRVVKKKLRKKERKEALSKRIIVATPDWTGIANLQQGLANLAGDSSRLVFETQ